MQISTRYLQFGQNAGIGKISALELEIFFPRQFTMFVLCHGLEIAWSARPNPFARPMISKLFRNC
jgi:hypothetical protein